MTQAERESRAILELHTTLCDVQDFDELPDLLLRVLGRHLYFDWVGIYQVVNHDTQVQVFTNSGVGFDWTQLYPEVVPLDPLAQATLSGKPGEIFMTQDVYDLSDERQLYAFEYARRHTDTVHALNMPLIRSEDCFVALGLYRCETSRPYTPQELDLLRRLSPLLISTARTLLMYREWRMHQQVFEALLERAEGSYAILDRYLNLVIMPEKMRAQLREAFGTSEAQPLPGAVRRWLACEVAPQGTLVPGGGPWTLSAHLPEGRLDCSARLAPLGEREPMLVLRVSQERTAEDFTQLSALGLTPREIEVLGCLPLGYTNNQIASLLDISEVTVKKHLRSIGDKLHAYGKTEIVYQALQQTRALRQGRGAVPSLSQEGH